MTLMFFSEIFITSKLWNTFHKRDDVIPNLKKTLSDLGLDYLDLYLIHWPMGWDNQGKPDVLRPMDDQGNIIFCDSNFEDTWKEMEKAVDLGLVKSIGVSNFNKKQVQRILDICTIKPVTNQEKFEFFNLKVPTEDQ